MKKLLIGLLALGSISSFGKSYSFDDLVLNISKSQANFSSCDIEVKFLNEEQVLLVIYEKSSPKILQRVKLTNPNRFGSEVTISLIEDSIVYSTPDAFGYINLVFNTKNDEIYEIFSEQTAPLGEVIRSEKLCE